jgi:hypothetical protein
MMPEISYLGKHLRIGKFYLHSRQQIAGDINPVTGTCPDIVNGLEI